ncbi:hypothetical protein Tco_0646441 [Tanacetum coccineum]
MVSASKDPLTFNDLMATLIDFLKYVLNRLKIDNLTQDILLGPAFNLLKGKSPYLTIAADYFFNNDLEYLKVKTMVHISAEQVLKGQCRLNTEDLKCEGDFVDLHLNDIEDLLLLVVQHRLFHLEDKDIRVTKKISITAPQKTFTRIKFKELYTPSGDPAGIVYEDLDKQPRVMRADELYKFLDGTLKAVCDELHHKILDFCLGYNTKMPLIKWMDTNKRMSELMVEMIDKLMLERRIIRTLERLVGA